MSTMTDLQHRLAKPGQKFSAVELAENWFQQTIVATIQGYGALAGHGELLSFVRRAWGSSLMRGASEQALDDAPCPWLPPCALNVFFHEQVRTGKHGVPKPYVLHADTKGQDLIISLSVFGFACDWIPAASERLVDALRNIVSWKRLGRDLFLPELEISDVRVGTISGLDCSLVPDVVEMQFLTPMDAEGSNDPLDYPHSVIGRLARRVDGLARWHDGELGIDWAELSQHWKLLEYENAWLDEGQTSRWSKRQKTNIENQAVSGSLIISGDLTPIWPLLQIGQHCHVGRGAVSGQGRFVVIV